MFCIFLRVCEQLCTCRHSTLRIPVFTGGFVSPVNIAAVGALSGAPSRTYINSLTSIINNNKEMGASTASSGAGYTTTKSTKETSAQNVHFVDGDTPWSYDVAHDDDPTTQLSGFSDAQLGDFLSRPLKIQEFQWTPGSQLFEVYNPWEDFFGNADVLEKINRFRNLRCNLKMKVLVNGNSFYYGRALLSYNPFLTNDQVTVDRAFYMQDIVQASQKPHILLDPCSSQGGELTLPFIWPENYLDITQSDWESEMGRVLIHDFDVLQHANGGTDPITVSVFVWAENLTLSVPTTSQAQSGKTERPLDEFGFPKPYVEQTKAKKMNNTSNNDEFTKDGLISKPASAIAKAADALSMIPVFTPYAKATSMVATRVGQIARIFGYSRPQILEDTRAYVPRYMGNLANSDAPENLVKLSLDSKNELTIDTRVMGLGGHDELTVNSIAQRPSFWRQFDWPETAVTDTLLASMLVSPACVQTLSIAPVTEIHMTALAFATAPFTAWQGSIKFRFNIVCSEYHRGRLRIVYNPTQNPPGAIPFNQTYSTIIDITEDRDFEYEVKWADIRAWGLNLGPDSYAVTPAFSTTEPVEGGYVGDNGTLSVYVVNELATPAITPADVKVQVWVSAGEDYAVSVPTVKGLNQMSVYKQQADVAPGEALAETNDCSNAPDCSAPIQTFGTDSDVIKEDNQFLVYQGERVVSFRELMRRYQYHNSYWPNETGTAYRMVAQDLSNFPYYRGWDPNGQDEGVDSGAATAPYTFCTMTLINWLTPAFALRRGALRHKSLLVGASQSDVTSSFHVARHNLLGTTNVASSHPLNGNVPFRRSEIQETLRPSLGGTHITPTAQNPCLEYETPFYTNGQRFVPARDLDYYAGVHDGHELSVEVDASTTRLTDPDKLRIDKYISIGEDFQLGMYVGPPIFYAYADPIPQ